MPRKMSGIAMIVIEPSSVARSTASVAFERAIHLYLSSPAVTLDQLYRQPVQAACGSPATLRRMAIESAPIGQEFRETLGRVIRRLRAEGGQPPVGQMAVLGR